MGQFGAHVREDAEPVDILACAEARRHGQRFSVRRPPRIIGMSPVQKVQFGRIEPRDSLRRRLPVVGARGEVGVPAQHPEISGDVELNGVLVVLLFLLQRELRVDVRGEIARDWQPQRTKRIAVVEMPRPRGDVPFVRETVIDIRAENVLMPPDSVLRMIVDLPDRRGELALQIDRGAEIRLIIVFGKLADQRDCAVVRDRP